jgi:DnaK suppressor protein
MNKKMYVMNQNAEKTRYSDRELEEFRVLIQEKLDKAREQLQFYMDQLAEMADNEDSKVKGLDDGIGTAENERLNAMAARQKKHIQHLENALIRIQNKAYGICRETGKLISKERLRAVPHATLSIEAKHRRSGD